MIASIATKKRFYYKKLITSKICHQENKTFEMKYERK